MSMDVFKINNGSIFIFMPGPDCFIPTGVITGGHHHHHHHMHPHDPQTNICMFTLPPIWPTTNYGYSSDESVSYNIRWYQTVQELIPILQSRFYLFKITMKISEMQQRKFSICQRKWESGSKSIDISGGLRHNTYFQTWGNSWLKLLWHNS